MRASTRRLWMGILACGLILGALRAEENWKKELVRDFDNISKARKNQALLHRGLVEKWRNANRLEEVVAEYHLRIAKEPDNPLLRYGLGYAHALRGNLEGYEEARVQFQRATELDPTFALAFFSLGGVLHQLGRQEEARVAYESCVRLDPTYVSAHYALGEIYRAKGDGASALQAYEKALENAPQDWARPHFGKGVVFFTQGHDAEAEIELTQAIRLDPSWAPAYFQLGQVRARQGRFAEALDLYRLGTEKGTPSSEDLQNLGGLLLSKGEYADAERFLRQAVERDPQNAEALFQWGEVLWALGRREDALNAYRQVPEHTKAFTEGVRERFFSAQMSAEEARKTLEKALALNPQNIEAHLLAAEVETCRGNLEDALNHYETATRLEPNRAELFLPMGDLYFAKGDTERATEAYRQYVHHYPTDAGRFLAAAQGAKPAEARILLTKHLLLNPDDAQARYQLAQALETLGEKDAAIAEYKRIPHQNEALLRLATLYEQQEQPDKALSAVEAFLALHPEEVSGHLVRARLLKGLGRKEEAIGAYERILSLKPDDRETYRVLAPLYEENQPAKALLAYRHLTELSPNDAEPFLKLSNLLLQQGDEESAIPVLTKALEIEPRRAHEQIALARMLAKRNRLEEAILHFLLATEIQPDDPVWQYETARAAHQLAQRTESSPERSTLVEKADAAYSAVLRLQPSAEAFYYRGLLRREYKQAGERLFLGSEIAEDFKQAIALAPSNVDARYALALTYLDMEAKDLAETTLRELLRIAPKYPNVHSTLGKLAEERHDFKGATALYRQEIAVNPKSAWAHYRYGVLVANSQGDLTTGMKHLEQTLALEPNHVNARIEYGMILYRLDRVAAAADQFERVLRIDPKNLTANYNLALMYQYLDKKHLAIERWRYLLTLDLPSEWRTEIQQHLRELEQN